MKTYIANTAGYINEVYALPAEKPRGLALQSYCDLLVARKCIACEDLVHIYSHNLDSLGQYTVGDGTYYGYFSQFSNDT